MTLDYALRGAIMEIVLPNGNREGPETGLYSLRAWPVMRSPKANASRLPNLTRPNFWIMHGVYVLQSKKDGTLYTGYSHDVKERVRQHQQGKVSATKNKLPIEVIYCELYKNRKDAMQRELFFKTGWGRKYTQKILKHTLQLN